MLDFADKHLLDKPVDRTFFSFPTGAELDAAAARRKQRQPRARRGVRDPTPEMTILCETDAAMRTLPAFLLACALPLAAATSETLVKNDQVEIVKVLAEPAHKTRDHEHKINRVMIYLDAGGQTTTYTEGTVVEQPWKAGEAFWSPTEGPHRVSYNTTAPVGLVKVELQQNHPLGSAPLGPLDPLEVDPAHYAVEFENEQVRVIRVKIPAGAAAPMHAHVRSRAVIYLTPAEFEATLADGSTVKSSYKRGDVVWADTPVQHSEVNRGGDFEGVVVELK